MMCCYLLKFDQIWCSRLINQSINQSNNQSINQALELWNRCSVFFFSFSSLQHVLIVEDIIDSGRTMEALLKNFEQYNMKSIRVVRWLSSFLPSQSRLIFIRPYSVHLKDWAIDFVFKCFFPRYLYFALFFPCPQYAVETLEHATPGRRLIPTALYVTRACLHSRGGGGMGLTKKPV